MEQFLASLIPWGTEAIRWVQLFGHPALDAFFRAVTFLGQEEAYVALLPLIYWCFSKEIGTGLMRLVPISLYANDFLKQAFALPRPSASEVRVLVHETSPSFPSNHAQTAGVVVWGYLASQVRRRAFWVLAVVLMVLIALSRVYLGVHYPQDVIGGAIIGLALLAGFLWGRALWATRVPDLALPAELALVTVVPLALLAAHPSEGAARSMGLLWGVGVGFALETRFVGFRVDGVWWRRALRFAVGLVVLLIFYVGLKFVVKFAVPADLSPVLTSAARTVRYAIVGLVGAWGVPWLFIRVSLAEAE